MGFLNQILSLLEGRPPVSPSRRPRKKSTRPVKTSPDEVVTEQEEPVLEPEVTEEVMRDIRQEMQEDIEQMHEVLADRARENEKLEKVLDSRRDEIDQLICGVTVQLQEMTENLNRQMEQMDVKTDRQIREIGDQLGAKVDEVSGIAGRLDQVEEMKQTLADMKEQLDVLKEIGSKTEAMKAEVVEQIHTENVKCYRNIKGLITDLEVKMDEVELGQESMNHIRKSFKGMKFFSFFAFLDFLAIAAIVLYYLGIIPKFF